MRTDRLINRQADRIEMVSSPQVISFAVSLPLKKQYELMTGLLACKQSIKRFPRSSLTAKWYLNHG
ncbi:hypothetical protein J6590_100654, partial [Homalodisca vitripennis]